MTASPAEVDAASQVARPALVGLTCPRCDTTSPFQVAEGWAELRCPGCTDRFTALVATVRAKSSKGDKRRQTRRYRIRIRHAATEELIEFAGEHDEIEMRAGDVVAFLYRRDTLYVVQNLTLGAATRLKTTHSYIAITVAAFATLAAILALRHWTG